MDLLTDLKAKYADGMITRTGYVLEACQLLQVDNPMGIDRSWLSDQIGMSYTATTKQLHRLRNKGLI